MTSRTGLVLRVSLPDDVARVSSTELAEVAELLRELAQELLPSADTLTELSLG
jgi:hypothetical protein